MLWGVWAVAVAAAGVTAGPGRECSLSPAPAGAPPSGAAAMWDAHGHQHLLHMGVMGRRQQKHESGAKPWKGPGNPQGSLGHTWRAAVLPQRETPHPTKAAADPPGVMGQVMTQHRLDSISATACLCPSAGPLASLCLDFPICKMGIARLTVGWVEHSVKSEGLVTAVLHPLMLLPATGPLQRLPCLLKPLPTRQRQRLLLTLSSSAAFHDLSKWPTVIGGSREDEVFPEGCEPNCSFALCHGSWLTELSPQRPRLLLHLSAALGPALRPAHVKTRRAILASFCSHEENPLECAPTAPEPSVNGRR
ncbi:PREDICTED: uncharacterized protein LOC106149392 isoform X2 [Chinchilla lanigera]|uniref:uncharacterized protein LOC106149392 isoform X2 n=1 Tax=Chinchilla lanigera TaxID=34839 RepID=UPI00069874AE|nr:PREDICTED: uncharacterized protein LOC106149392 isoform X2 [Chinchilla lanigera]